MHSALARQLTQYVIALMVFCIILPFLYLSIQYGTTFTHTLTAI